MKEKKQDWLIFLRTLAAFLAFWLLMVLVLTANNWKSNKDAIGSDYNEVANLAVWHVQMVLEGTAAPEEKPAIITWRLSTEAGYDGSCLSLSRVYDDQGDEAARSQISMGSFSLPGTGVYDHFIFFDPVLTDGEQIALAKLLRTDKYALNRFFGAEDGLYEDAPNPGLYGEVTGIQQGNVIYPQKLVYYYEDRTVTLLESDNAMFDAAELTTLRFDAALITSALAWGEPSPEELLELYRRAEDALDELMGRRSASEKWAGTRSGDACTASYSVIDGVPIARAYAYTPWRVATDGLGFTYIATLLAALLAAVVVSRMQIKSMKKERQLTRAVAHELKTPAAVLRAYAEALGEDAVPGKRQEYLDAIVEESDRMAALVNELLDLSRLEGSAGTLARQPVDLPALVREGFERLRVPMEERSLTLELDLEPVTVEGDPGRLGQMVSNLAVNALHHASPGPVRVELKWEDARAVLTVENRCPPLPPEQLKRLWEPFAKGDESRSGEGGGLGLAVVRSIVFLHGGSCRAESLPDGIRFRVELP
ncbi:MAG: sensor histidine kinase [Oscillospiraceae bacterium]